MQAEVVAIGTELLLGDIVDTNSSWIARQLTTLGLNLFYTHTVGDNVERISEVLRNSLARSHVVITTGGLGPTVDDWTREAVAAALNRELELDNELLEEIRAFFKRRGREMTDNNRRQAMIPAGAEIIHNPVGTAPCFAVTQGDHIIISLPGVPFEMKHLMQTQVVPLLKQRYQLTGVIKSRVLHTCGIGESALANHFTELMQLSNPTVGTAAHPGQTDIRITVKAADDAQAEALIMPIETELRARVGAWIYGVDSETLPGVVLGVLQARHLTLATYETVCAGNLAAWVGKDQAAPGTYLGGLGTTLAPTTGYASPLEALISNPESSQEENDRAAQAIRLIFNADLGLALTGASEQAAKDDSLAFLSLATREGVVHIAPRRGRAGENGRGWLLHYALDFVRRHLLELPLEQ